MDYYGTVALPFGQAPHESIREAEVHRRLIAGVKSKSVNYKIAQTTKHSSTRTIPRQPNAKTPRSGLRFPHPCA